VPLQHDPQMLLRVVIVLLASATAIISLWAMAKSRSDYQLFGIVVWCANITAFTIAAILNAHAIVSLSVAILNAWSSVVRIHGLIVALTIAIYFLKTGGRFDIE
jgi:hypothetical protein